MFCCAPHLITKSLRLWPYPAIPPNRRHSAGSPKSGGKICFQKHRSPVVGASTTKRTPRKKGPPAFFCWKQPLISLFNPRKLVFCSKKDLCSHQARKDFKESSTNLLLLFQTLFAGYIYINISHAITTNSLF